MGQRCSVAAWDDTWRIEMKCAFPGPRQLRVAVLHICIIITQERKIAVLHTFRSHWSDGFDELAVKSDTFVVLGSNSDEVGQV